MVSQLDKVSASVEEHSIKLNEATSRLSELESEVTELSGESIDFWLEGEYYNKSMVLQYNANYKRSLTLSVKKGDKIFVKTAGDNVGIICRNENKVPVEVLLSSAADATNDDLREYFYEVPSDMDIVLSYKYGIEGSGYSINGVVSQIGKIENELNSINEKIDVLHPGARKLKVLVLGNSYAADAWTYVPMILKNYGIDIEIRMYYRGALALDQLYNRWESKDYQDIEEGYLPGTYTRFTYYCNTGVGLDFWRISNNRKSAKECVEEGGWDIISIQQQSAASLYEESYEPYAKYIIDLIRQGMPTPYTLAFSEIFTRPTHDEIDVSLDMQHKFYKKEPFNMLLPYGTAIYNARAIESLAKLGDSVEHNLWCPDEVHIQEGLPKYIAALTIVQSIFDRYYEGMSVLGDTLRVTDEMLSQWEMIERRYNCVGITEENCLLAQKCAIMAVRSPWEISRISLPSEKREIALSSSALHIVCNGGVGQVCDMTPVTSQSGLHYAIIELTEKDRYFLINGIGGSGPRLWCFLDKDNVILSAADAYAEENDLLLQVPLNARYLILNSRGGGVSYRYYPSSSEFNEIHDDEIKEIKGNVAEIEKGISVSMFREQITPNINAYNDSERKTFCLAGLDTAITNNAMPYTQGLLWHTYPKSDGTLYYSTSVEGEKEVIGKMSQWNPIGRIFAISPKDKRVICTYTEKRAGICVFDGENTTLLESINGVKPCGWLYNSGVDFINDGEDEYCIFAEYGMLNEFHVWRGKYPYTSESDWEIVLTKSNEDITHLHQIRRDPWTDILYCTSGDYVGKLYWWYSLDKGKTWIQLTDGTLWESHCARCINFIFTEDYIYWATDYGENHSLNRIKRGNDGIIDITTREKLADLPYGQATNSICYHEGANGIFMYERLDSTFQEQVKGYYTLFYSIDEAKLYKLKYYTLNDKEYQDFIGTTSLAWGGHRGKCYLNYANAQIPYPMMGFTVYTPCIINLIGTDNRSIGTIYYKL